MNDDENDDSEDDDYGSHMNWTHPALVIIHKAHVPKVNEMETFAKEK